MPGAPRDARTRLAIPGREAIWASPLVADGRVYVAAMDHHVYCLDAETGRGDLESQGGRGHGSAAYPVMQARHPVRRCL